ncbi:helix-turn-helix domain-containing protein [Flavobacterium suzhouense]|uniref:Helix-turn-helix domain-containing protein n=1 Tax=Flavobacterium suzhouense TaxID=1529638 RepID=A0ABW5NS88_9FLAO
MDSTGNFITIKPKDEVVAKYIDYYYFHVSDDPLFTKRFFFYPNYKHAITVYKGSDVSLTEEGSVVLPSADDTILSFYSINTDQNFKVQLNGIFNKVGIVFNPLGLNHFLKEPLGNFFDQATNKLDCFGASFVKTLQSVFAERDAEAKGTVLDTFFADAFSGFNEPVVKKAVQEILNSNGSVKVDELSELLNVNRKTLLRLFKKHLCCSVEEYKKLVMFRNALNYSQAMGEEASLTDVALYSLYYDQAHYIKHFKSVTNQSPKALLSKLTKLGSQETYWYFED